MKALFSKLTKTVASSFLMLAGVPELTLGASDDSDTFQIEKGSHFQVVLEIGSDKPVYPRDKAKFDSRFFKLQNEWLTTEPYPRKDAPNYVRHLKFQATGSTIMPDHTELIVPTPNGPVYYEFKILERK